MAGCAVTVSGPEKAPPPETIAGQSADDVAARIGDRVITREELDRRVKMVSRKRRQKPSTEEVARLLDTMVEQALFAEAARTAGLDRDEAVQAIIRDATEKILAGQYFRTELLPAMQVTDAAVRQYYDDHPRVFQQAETVRARHILIRVRSDDDAAAVSAAEAKARMLRQRLLDGENFAELARSHSDDTGTRNKGGDMGFFDRRGKSKALADAAFALQIGEISPPVRSSVGYHVLRLDARRPASVKPFEAVRDEIRGMLFKQQRLETVRRAREELESRFAVFVDPQLRVPVEMSH
jgi:peptidyl-prolyl cis-trans isomerase C